MTNNLRAEHESVSWIKFFPTEIGICTKLFLITDTVCAAENSSILIVQANC